MVALCLMALLLSFSCCGGVGCQVSYATATNVEGGILVAQSTAAMGGADENSIILPRSEAEAQLLRSVDVVNQVPDSIVKARLLLDLGLDYIKSSSLQKGKARAALPVFLEVERLALAAADHRTVSAALGSMAAIYEDEQRLSEALQLSRRAAFAAQEAAEPRLLYQWHWQSARLLQGLGDMDGALTAYRLATAEVKALRERAGDNCQAGAQGQSLPIMSLYKGEVDLLLRRADTLRDQPSQRAADLREARETIELFKVSELRDYFQDDCLAALQAKTIAIDSISAQTAVIYPVILPDRVELLISIGGWMQSYPVAMPGPELCIEIIKFRASLETRTSAEYLPISQHLYDLLMRPMSADLMAAGVKTLVIVPDGAFRVMPFDALHDGQQFLVAKYATAITPGLSLIDPQPLTRGRVTALAVGISKSVQGFPSLPAVAGELAAFHDLFGGYELVDEQFQVVALEKVLRENPINMIHIASHGNFGHDAAQTFLLAYDQKLTMDRLSQLVGMFRFRQEPLELLTLSACQTAAGDERAALGLAGVAVKSGARSAVAALWFINDQASSSLFGEFYRQLQYLSTSKAEALRQAKLSLLADRRYRHPAYWAPFLLINNWL